MLKNVKKKKKVYLGKRYTGEFYFSCNLFYR